MGATRRPLRRRTSTPAQGDPVSADLFRLTEDQRSVREAIRELARAEIAPFAAECDEQERYPIEAQKALTAAGFNAVHIPEAYGGPGADAVSTVLVIEEVARACATSSLIPAVNKLGTVPLLLGASEEVKQRYLAQVARGEGMFSYALSEPEAGSDAGAMRTRAVRTSGGYVLNGVKRWITNAGVSKFYTVMAVTDPDKGANGITAFVVEDGDPGFTFGAPEHKLGIKGSPTRELYFDNCEIPSSRLVGDEGQGFKIALRTLDHTRVTIAAQALGIAQGALDYSLGYVKERKQFGKAIADFQGLQFMIADMAMKLEAARQLTYAAAARSERAMQGEKVPDLTFFSSACKTMASDVAMAVTTDAVQLLGGYGYVNDYPVERMMRDAKITQIYEGTNQIQRMVMARQLLKG
jgi:alkylation response protein AidB-like acyl-CoA dehydrogenase